MAQWQVSLANRGALTAQILSHQLYRLFASYSVLFQYAAMADLTLEIIFHCLRTSRFHHFHCCVSELAHNGVCFDGPHLSRYNQVDI